MKTNKVLIDPNVVVSTLKDNRPSNWTNRIYTERGEDPCLKLLLEELDCCEPNNYNFEPKSKYIRVNIVYKHDVEYIVNRSDFISINDLSRTEINNIKKRIIEQYMIYKGIKNDNQTTT